jgi:hypothetical protein
VFGFSERLEQLQHLAFQHRFAIVEALCKLATDGAQKSRVFRGFNPFCDHVLAELLCERHDRADNGGTGTIAATRRHQIAMDFDGVDREALQVGE